MGWVFQTPIFCCNLSASPRSTISCIVCGGGADLLMRIVLISGKGGATCYTAPLIPEVKVLLSCPGKGCIYIARFIPSSHDQLYGFSMESQGPPSIGMSPDLATYREQQEATKLEMTSHFDQWLWCKAADVKQGRQLLKPL